MNIRQESDLNAHYDSLISHADRLDGPRPKVLALAHSVNLAGAQLALASLVKNTYEQIDWTVVCPNDGPFVEKIDSYATPLITERYPWWCRGKSFIEPPANFDPRELNKVLDGVPYDAALTNTITVPWLAYNAKLRDLPHLWYVHEFGDLDHDLQFSLGYDDSISYINHMSDTVLTVSRSVGEHLLEHGASQDTLKYVSQSFEVDAYMDLEPPVDEKNLLILGSIKEGKGQLDALVGFDNSTIKETHTLTIAGPVTDTHYADMIDAYIRMNGLQGKVDFIAQRVNAIERMRDASALLVCSRNEALGRVTLEALAAGRVVVGNRGGGTESLLEDSRGVIYDGSVDDLTRKLDGLVEETEHLQPVNVRRQYVSDNFSPDNERNDFLDALEQATRHHREMILPGLGHHMAKTGIMAAMKRNAIIA